MVKGALFSPCMCYRYRLWRIWNRALPLLAVCMLNPSTADHNILDPTILRVMTRAIAMGYGGIIIMNAYAFRSTYPEDLYPLNDPVGPHNNIIIKQVAALPTVGMFLVGWGTHCDKVRKFRSQDILDTIRSAGKVPHALQINANGSPKHPLYVDYAIQPTPMY